MIATSIQDYLQEQGLSSQLKSLIARALDIIQQYSDTGRYDIEGDQAFVLISTPETEKQEARQAEYHYRYLDIQILLEGAERLGYGLQLASAEPDEDYSATQDITFCKTINNEQFLQFEAGDLAVFFPREYHRPLCTAQGNGLPIKKAVIKVNMDFIREH